MRRSPLAEGPEGVQPVTRLDPRTKILLGAAAMAAIFLSVRPATMVVELILLLAAVFLLGVGRPWVRSLRLMGPMVALVFAIALLSFDMEVALLLSLRLTNLLTASFVLFHAIQPDELGGALRKMGVPHEFGFILTTALRYVPLLGLKARSIMDAQRSRGIDLRPRLGNLRNFVALLLPLLAQSFTLAEDLAIAMESRGFGRKGRSSRRTYRIAFWEYGLMMAWLAAVVGLAWWEKG
jgi:energy-coupling factor transport system permease protein